MAQPKKTVGVLGATLLRKVSDLEVEVNHQPVHLPNNKEEIERYFALPFVEEFNRLLPLGPDKLIHNITQNDTSDLDFRIEAKFADYIELAELNPKSEIFGRNILDTGGFDIFEYCEWIFHRIIQRKHSKYGRQNPKIILVLYATHWQFKINLNAINCLRAFVQQANLDFCGIYYLRMLGGTDPALENLGPPFAPSAPPPRFYQGKRSYNQRPGGAWPQK